MGARSAPALNPLGPIARQGTDCAFRLRSNPGKQDGTTSVRGATRASQRRLRVGRLVRHALAELLGGEVRDEVLERHVITPSPKCACHPTCTSRHRLCHAVGRQGCQARSEMLDRLSDSSRARSRGALICATRPKSVSPRRKRFDEAERIEELLRHLQIRRDLDGEKDEIR